VTAAQLREVIARLIAAGRWREGDPDIIAVLDAGYDPTRLAWLLDDLPVDITGRLRSDRVMHFPAPPLPARPASTGGRRPRHGHKLAFGDPATWPEPAVATRTETSRYGTAVAMAWGRMHQRLAHRDAWAGHEGELPVVEGALIRLQVDHLPGQRDAEPVWLWSSRAGVTGEEVNRAWQAFLRRFDIEHMFRFCKQQLGWARPKLRDPAAADRWTWLVIAAYVQLHLARDLADDIRLPWQQPCPPGRLTPSRVRRGYRRIRQDLPVPASAPKPSRPGPGRPKGSKNQRPATRHDVGKTVKREETRKKTPQAGTLNNKLRPPVDGAEHHAVAHRVEQREGERQLARHLAQRVIPDDRDVPHGPRIDRATRSHSALYQVTALTDGPPGPSARGYPSHDTDQPGNASGGSNRDHNHVQNYNCHAP
jgi:hypothetical protein